MLIRSRAVAAVRPPVGAQIDWGHRLAANLKACFLFNESGGAAVSDLVDNRQYAMAGISTPMWSAAAGQAGGPVFLRTIGAGVGVQAAAPLRLQLSVVSLVWRGIITANSDDGANIAGVSYTDATNTPQWAYHVQRSGSNYTGIYNRAGTSQNVGSTGVTVHPKNVETSFVLTVRSGAQALYTRGRLVSGSSFSFASINYGANPQLCIGGLEPGTSTRNAQTLHSQLLIYDRILSADEVMELWNEPYAMIARNVTRRLFAFAPAAGTVSGAAGIPSGEAFGVGGSISGPLSGSSGIVSGETFGSTGAIIALGLTGLAGIPTAETFGGDGSIAGPLNGLAGIPSGEAFGVPSGAAGSIAGPLNGLAGIVSAEAFGVPSGAAGSIAGPLAGAVGIPTAEAFGVTGGAVYFILTGGAGIASGEAFGADGSIDLVTTGYLGIPSAEKFGRGGAILHMDRPFGLFIRGRDWTTSLRVDTMQVAKEYGGGGRSSATFTLVIDTLGLGFRPSADDEVAYYCGGRRLFGGILRQVKEKPYQSTWTVTLECSAVGYRDLLEARTFGRTYTGPTFTLSQIMADIQAAVLTAEGLTYYSLEDYTVSGSRLAFNDEPGTQVLDRVAGVFGCDWRVDDYRRVRMERRLADVAPKVLREDGLWESMAVTRDSSQYRNRQGARTSAPTAGQRSAILAGAGAWSYTLPFQLTGKPRVSVNGTAKTVALWSERHLAPWDFAYELNTSTVYHNPAQAAYTSSDEIAITALSGALDVHWSESAAEIRRRAARTGGSGIVEAVSQAVNVKDQRTAARFNENMMARLSQDTITIEVELSTAPDGHHLEGRAGWDIGQMVSVGCQCPLVFGDFLITAVAFREVGATFLRYAFTAKSRELPLVLGVEVSGGPDPGTWIVDIIADRPIGEPGTDISLWGLNNLGADDPLNGSWIIDSVDPEPGTGGVLIRFSPPDIDLTDWVYTGGLGGTDGLGGSGWGGGFDPFGGVIGTSGLLPTGPDGGPSGGIVNPTPGALIVVAVNLSTREITTDRDHGFTTSYPAFDSGTRVVVMGIRGAEDNTHSLNTGFSRITVTGADTFILEDVGPFDNPTPFENDRRGRVYTTDQAPRFNSGGDPLPTNVLATLNAAGTEGNGDAVTATFLLASSIPGVASRPLQVVSAATNPWTQQRDISVVESVYVSLGTPSEGGPVRIDIKRNGASIFAAGYVEIPAGVSEIRTSEFAANPMTVERGDKLQPDVVAVGPDFPGCNATVNVHMRG